MSNLQVTGTIKAVRKDRRSILMDDEQWYGIWDAANLQADKGDVVTFDYKEKGIYKNVVGKVVGSGNQTANTAPAGKGYTPPSGGRSFPVAPLAPERTINRQNALTNAVKYSEQFPTPYSVAEVLAVAREFEAYTTGDLDLALAKAELDGEEQHASIAD